ncbi:MFS transporter [Pseudoroseicyclus aestuarii]|uniref:EmrB/QacA subfamily drug resistance transporter n=1 Tax=Pseudoroseicyclus aestuarii TaxID=1795041 RepID=A0A318SZW2_9RHOB|nr:MFS transporter [Pseudoroseicyclus aestuarii]PYE85347.1 EmrB/QacA subfamily drug resistance transporter [Pseudoroseicyclus aestuarii]
MTVAEGPPPARRGARFFVIPLIVSTGFLMEALDTNIITASMPAMAQDFGVAPERLAIGITAYIVAMALAMPLAGWIADRFGAKRVFISAIAVFTLASILCGLSQGLEQLVAARVLQGAGAALMTPVGRLILLRSFGRSELVRAITWMTMPVLIGPLIGPLLGGFLTTYYSWRWIFFVNLPVGLLGALTAWRYVEDLPARRPGRFDLRGFAILGAGLVAFQAAIELLVHPVVHPQTIWLLAASALVLLGCFVGYARNRPGAVLDLGLMAGRPFRSGVLFGGLSRIGMNAVPFLLQLKLQLAMGFTPFQAGAVVFVTAFGAICLKPMTGWMLRRTGFRRLLSINAAAGAVLTAGFAALGPGLPIAVMLAYVFVFGFVRSLQFNAINALVYSEIDPARQSASVTLAGVAQQLSMGLGVSLSAALLAQGVTAEAAIFDRSFLVMALVPLISALGFRLALRPSDGAETSGHRV